MIRAKMSGCEGYLIRVTLPAGLGPEPKYRQGHAPVCGAWPLDSAVIMFSDDNNDNDDGCGSVRVNLFSPHFFEMLCSSKYLLDIMPTPRPSASAGLVVGAGEMLCGMQWGRSARPPETPD